MHYEFDYEMSLPRLNEIIKRMEKNGFEIRAIVCDMGNKKLISQLKIHDHNYFFENPADPTRKVYVFPDAPHLIKCARNAMLDHGFSVPAKNENQTDMFPLNIKHFEELLQKHNSELNVVFKLTPNHLYGKGSKRQNVRTAAQLFSNSVSKAMSFRHHNDEAALARSAFIKKFNDWFDTVNSSNKYAYPFIKSGFGLHPDDQMKALDDMANLMLKFKVYDEKLGVPTDAKKNALTWWHAILVHIQSTISLHHDMVLNGPLEYILMRRLNQDCLENYFSRFRAIGGDNNHPGPVAAIKRIRNLMLTKNAKFIVNKPSVQIEYREETERQINEQEDQILSATTTQVLTEDYEIVMFYLELK